MAPKYQWVATLFKMNASGGIRDIQLIVTSDDRRKLLNFMASKYLRDLTDGPKKAALQWLEMAEKDAYESYLWMSNKVRGLYIRAAATI